MKYIKILALTVLCMGFVSVYAQQANADLPERDAGATTVQKDRASQNPNIDPAGQAGDQTMFASSQAVPIELDNASKEKQINPELNPNEPSTQLPEPERTASPDPNKSTQQGNSPNDDPNQVKPFDK